MLTYGVPAYRLKNKLAVAECRAIEHLGANVYYNTKIGRDITMNQLEEKYDAIFIGIGLWKSRDLPIPGAKDQTSFAEWSICAYYVPMIAGLLERTLWSLEEVTLHST